MEKRYIDLAFLTVGLLFAVTGCDGNTSGVRYYGGTSFSDSNLYGLLFLSLPLTALFISGMMDGSNSGSDFVVIIGLAALLNFMAAVLVGSGDPGEIQAKNYTFAYLLISVGGGAILGFIINAIRNL
jgi:hypothetical protein